MDIVYPIVVKAGTKKAMIVTNVMILVKSVMPPEVAVVLLVKLHINYIRINVLKVVQKDLRRMMPLWYVNLVKLLVLIVMVQTHVQNVKKVTSYKMKNVLLLVIVINTLKERNVKLVMPVARLVLQARAVLLVKTHSYTMNLVLMFVHQDIMLMPKLILVKYVIHQKDVKVVQTLDKLVYLVQLVLTYKMVHVLEIVTLVSMKPLMVHAKLVINIVPPVKMPLTQTVKSVKLLIS